MPKLIALKIDDTTVWVEAAEGAAVPGSAIEAAGARDVAGAAVATTEHLIDSIKAFCGKVVGSLRELDDKNRPTKAELEFGLNLSAEGNVYVVKGKAEASVKIKAEWDFAKPTQ